MANVLPTFAEHTLPSNSTPLERVLAATVNTRIADIPVPLKLLNDPYACPASFLSHLAFEVGVDIWNEDWDELKKRSVIATTIRTKMILGTVKGIEAYIGLEGGRLIDVVTPPQTPFLSKSIDGTQDYIDYLGRLPQIRVYFGNSKGTKEPGAFFIGQNAYVGSAILSKDNGRSLLGRRAFHYDPGTGVETRITLEDLGVDSNGDKMEQVKLPGKAATQEAFVGSGFIGHVFLKSRSEVPPQTVPYKLPKNQSLDAGALALTLGASLNVVSTRFDRMPSYGKADATQMFIGRGFVGRGFVSSNDAVVDFYDRMYLADPSVPAPVTKGTSYIGHSRLQMEPYRAEMLIDAQEMTTPQVAFTGRFIGHCFVVKQDDTKRRAILKAIELSKAGRDRVFVDFKVTKSLSFGDAPKMDGTFRFGQRLPRHRL